MVQFLTQQFKLNIDKYNTTEALHIFGFMKYVPSAHPAVANTISSEIKLNNMNSSQNFSNFLIGYNGICALAKSLQKGIFLFDANELYYHYNPVNIMP